MFTAAGNVAITAGHSTMTEGGAIVISSGSGAIEGGALLLVSGSSANGGSGSVSLHSTDTNSGKLFSTLQLPSEHMSHPLFITAIFFPSNVIKRSGDHQYWHS